MGKGFELHREIKPSFVSQVNDKKKSTLTHSVPSGKTREKEKQRQEKKRASTAYVTTRSLDG